MRAIFDDVLSGDSVLLKAIAKTYRELGVGQDQTHEGEWAVVMLHWATAMRAAYKLRATEADRAVFREHTMLYVTTKSMIRAGTTTWYDWQLYSVFPKIFDKFGSLAMISQEGVEACIKRQNMLLRMGNHCANVGRIPYNIWKAGLEVKRAYMEKRKRSMKTPAADLWWKNTLSFASKNDDVLKRVERYRLEGLTLDWKTQHEPQKVSFKCISTIKRIVRARLRQKVAWRTGTAGRPSWATTHEGTEHHVAEKVEDERKRPEVAFPAQWNVPWTRSEPLCDPAKCVVPRNFTVKKVTNTHTEALCAEIVAYYAPVPCQGKPNFSDWAPHVQRKEVQKQRVKRWQERKRSALWVAHPEKCDCVWDACELQ